MWCFRVNSCLADKKIFFKKVEHGSFSKKQVTSTSVFVWNRAGTKQNNHNKILPLLFLKNELRESLIYLDKKVSQAWLGKTDFYICPTNPRRFLWNATLFLPNSCSIFYSEHLPKSSFLVIFFSVKKYWRPRRALFRCICLFSSAGPSPDFLNIFCRFTSRLFFNSF